MSAKLSQKTVDWLKASNCFDEVADDYLSVANSGIVILLCRRAVADLNRQAADADGVEAAPAPQPTPYGLAGIEGDAIVIRFTADACAFAFANDPQAHEPRPPVLDKRQFLRDTLNEVTAEREDGSAPLTDMLDRAMVKAMQNGSAALDYDAIGVGGSDA